MIDIGMTETLADIADLAVKLERYKFANSFAACWVISICFFAGSLLLATSLTLIEEYVFNLRGMMCSLTYFVAVFVACVLVVHLELKVRSNYVPRSVEENEAILRFIKFRRITFPTAFTLGYLTASLLPMPGSLKYYLYVTIWYVIYGICCLVVSVAEEKLVKLGLLPINSFRIAGTSIVITSVILYLPLMYGFNIDRILMSYGFCTSIGMILLIQLAVYFLIVHRLNRVLYE